MNTVHRFAIAAAFVVLSAAVSVFAAPELPGQLVTHWNAAGEADGTMAKPVALVFVPGLAAGLLGLFAILPRLDPLGENVAEFRSYYDWFVVLTAGFLAALHVGIVAVNLGYEFDVTRLIVGAVAVLLYGAGVLLEAAERNWFVGIRTPWTLSSEEVWDRTHDLGATLFKATAVIALVGAVVVPEYAIYALLVPVMLTVVVTSAYSYVCYRRLDATPSIDADA